MEEWINTIPEIDREKVKDQYKKAKTFDEKVGIVKDQHPKGYINIEPIRNLEEYFKYLRIATLPSTWFRGESKEFEFLIPKLYRNTEESNIKEQLIKERKLLFEFRRRARPFAPKIDPNDIWSWYFLVQHYGGPTRLLDWTTNATIALFFALDSDPNSKENPIVITLQPTVLTNYAFKDINYEKSVSSSVLYPGEIPTEKWINNLTSESFEIPDSPLALFPAYSDPRIIAQSSCFTLFGKLKDGFYKDGKQILCPCCDNRVIHKLVIDGNSKNDLRKEIYKIGITSGKVYPGLEGLNKEVVYEIF
jgi:hypothetical protein